MKQLQNDANNKLKIKVNEISTALEDDYEVCFELITTSGLTEAAEKNFQALQASFSEDESLSANLVLIDRDMLKTRYEEALNLETIALK